MNLQAVLQKTEKGVEEIKTRGQKLEQRLRMLLIVVNGKTTGADLVKQFESLGDITPILEQLVAQGYVREAVAPAGSEFKEMRVRLSQALTDAMGPAGDTIVMRLQECKTLDELREFLADNLDPLQGAYGKRVDKFVALARTLLG